MSHPLSKEIEKEYKRLVKVVTDLPIKVRTLKKIDGTGGKVSVEEIIAYQIGWGRCLIRWYEEGIQGRMPEMPGEGFSNWDYVGIAKSFYQQYAVKEQMKMFDQVVFRILDIVAFEDRLGRLDQIGVWSWCTLPSGKQWPLSKWIRVNTASPYKRAFGLIKKAKF